MTYRERCDTPPYPDDDEITAPSREFPVDEIISSKSWQYDEITAHVKNAQASAEAARKYALVTLWLLIGLTVIDGVVRLIWE